MNNSILLFVFLVFGAKQIYSQNSKVTAFKELKAIISSGYDKEIRPNLGENVTEIGITMHIFNQKFDENQKELITDVYFRQMWTDPRLINQNTEEFVKGGQQLVDNIWTPDTFFTTSVSVKTFKYPNPNVFVKIAPNGTVFFSERLQLNIRCNKKNESAFECPLEFESYGFDAKDIKYYLKKGSDSMSIAPDPNESDKQYKLVNSTIHEDTITLSTGIYSRIYAKLIFENKEVQKDAPVNTNILIGESKKIHKMLSNIKLPTFGQS